MVKLKLVQGFLIKSWEAVIIPIEYCETVQVKFGSEESVSLVFSDNKLIDVLSQYQEDKVFSNIKDAEDHLKEVKRKRLAYFENEIKKTQDRIEKLKNQ